MNTIRTELQPLAEKWARVKLEHSATYGIRSTTSDQGDGDMTMTILRAGATPTAPG